MTQSTLPVTDYSSLFGDSWISQNARLITLETAQGSDLPDSLVAESVSGFEAVNALFRFDIEALSLSTEVDLKQFIGEEITLRLLQADGSYRAWHGYCTEASWLGADGGLARYHLRLEPFLAFLRLRRDAFIFQDKDVRQIITELLADYPQAQIKWDVTQTLALRPICNQYRESDLDFLTRLLASEGLSFRFEHEQQTSGSSPGGAQASTSASTSGSTSHPHAKHTLVIFDSQTEIPAMPGDTELRFHGIRATETTDSIREFSATRQVQANAVSLSSWDHAQVSAPASETASDLAYGELPTLEVYDGSRERQHADSTAADQLGQLRLQALELGNKAFEGAGAVRQLAAGHAFSLTQHEHYPDGSNEFSVLTVQHDATNNLDPGMARLLPGNALERGTYRNRFTCVRDSVAIVPPLTAHRPAPTALGTQVALVVGLDSAPLTTDRDHRIKIQFPWQRGTAPQAGGLSHTNGAVDATGNAPGNEHSGTWVRVAEALSGPNWGSHFTPRIGAEVLVDFIEGDMDRPVIVASLYNGADLPPYSAGVDSGVNHAGWISGIHSHNLQDGGYNQWVLDDSPSQLRMRLACSTAASQLNLGYLIHQSPTTAQRGAYRGQGFEWRSDAWGILRGAEGVLLSTTARAQQGSSVTSTQMDAAESVAQLNAAKALSETLSQAATHQTALTSQDAAQAQLDLIKAIDPKQQGKYSGNVNGQEALKASAGSRTLDSAQPVEKFASPIILVDSASTLNLASPASTTLFADGQLHWTTQADSHWAAAHTFATVSGNATSLFTHSGGIQAIAANAPVSIQAHTDQLEILADQDITVTSVNNRIEINAQQKITLQAGQSSIVLEGGNITFTCPGHFSVKGAQHSFDGAGAKAAELTRLPDSRVKLFDEAFQIKDPTGQPIPELPYKITTAEGDIYRGVTDVKGYTERIATADASKLKIEPDDVISADITEPFDEQIQFVNAKGALLSKVGYTLLLDDGSTVKGVTDDEGKTRRVVTKASQGIKEATLQPRQQPGCCAVHAQNSVESTSPLTIKVKNVVTNQDDVGASVEEVKVLEETARGLTSGEIAMAKLIFKDSIDYAKVKIHNGEYLWFGMQPDDTAMTPNGEMYFNEKYFKEDFSASNEFDRHWFMHEMVHIWQYQLGYPVKFRGAIRIGLSYEYTLEANKRLSDYNMEAQGDILADYFAHTQLNFPATIRQISNRDDAMIPLYKIVLENFLSNPSDKNNLP